MMIVTTAMTPVGGTVKAALVLAHVGVAALAVGAQLGRMRPEVFLLALDAVIVVGFSATDSVESLQSFVLVWMLNLTYSFSGFLLADRRRSACFSAATVVALPLAIGWVQPDWRWLLVASTALTGAAISVAVAVAVRRLDGFADTVDAEVEEGARARRAVAASRASALEGAERARVLHDTVINTLGAVARGGGATRRLDRVRDRCNRDIPVVQAVLAGHELPMVVAPLEEVAREQGIALRRTGLEDAELERVTALMPGEVLTALVMATRESIVNVGRHAQVGSADLHIEDEGEALVVTVSDAGVGFDGAAIPGRGLAESVRARCEQAGIAVSVQSAVGSGTEVEMRCPLRATEAVPMDGVEQADFEATVTGLQRRTALAWSSATVVVGLVIEVTNRFGRLVPTYGMLAIGAACLAIAWLDLRRHGRLSTAAQVVLLAAVPPAFLFAAAGVDFGRTDPVMWQAIGVTGPLVLLTLVPSKVPYAIGMALLLASAVSASIVVLADSATAAAIVFVGALPAAWVAGALLVFSRAIERVGARAVLEQRASLRARAEQAAADAAEEARERWRHAGLQACLRLLEDLASGRSDPEDDEVRAACAQEERYLRNLGLLNPGLRQIGYWLARSLTLARSRGLQLAVRTGDVDVDEATARRFGELLQRVIESVPVSSELTATVFPAAGGARLAVVGPAPWVSGVASDWQPPEGWSASVESHVGFDIVEVVRSGRSVQTERVTQEAVA